MKRVNAMWATMCILFATSAVHAQERTGILDQLLGKGAEPVEPERAFAASAKRTAANRVVVDFAVRPGDVPDVVGT